MIQLRYVLWSLTLLSAEVAQLVDEANLSRRQRLGAFLGTYNVPRAFVRSSHPCARTRTRTKGHAG